MKSKNRIATKECIIIILSWIAIYYFYFLIAFWGISPFLKDSLFSRYLSGWYVHVELISGTILFGLIFCLIDYLTDRSFIRKKSFGSIILIKSFLYGFMILFVFGAVYGLFYVFDIGPFQTPEQLPELIEWKFIVSWLIFFVFSVVFITFMVQVNRKFGPGNLIKMITGKYHKPKDEHRIFLFLDLKNSTTIAEKLGHKNYSQFIKNCYHDLTDVILKYKADIYQYVGDEVVLSWENRGVSNSSNGIKLFFEFQQVLRNKSKFYLDNFGILPEFRGGMDLGVVTIAEVGDLKREMQYHGDVLNTAARIQEKCKEVDVDLLISENLKNQIEHFHEFNKKLIGEFVLRGKQKPTKIFEVTMENTV